MKHSHLFALVAFFGLTSCFNSPPPSFPEGDVVGYEPVYLTEIDNSIELTSARAVEDPGQIYVLGDLVFINDVGKGIHIVDNTDPSNPVNQGFLQVQGSENMVIRNGIVYVNQYNSLLAIDVNDPENIQVISRDVDVLKSGQYDDLLPPLSGYYFECPDESLGTIVGWRLTTISNPKCYR
ncbi:hypothetical protein [Roseivirga sp. E12]|uniref:hypothetical protein n=1 Tax=Roseivirga sp. E12 TaxID=2819237 RepID=UPI001ABCC84A|nr:hypothetical protein [Roseivirga sp. E12]MBO3697567.1 hypothetical protein [Roseivirga sp. E12]